MGWLVFGPAFIVVRIVKIIEDATSPARRRELIRQQTRDEVAAAEQRWRRQHGMQLQAPRDHRVRGDETRRHGRSVPDRGRGERERRRRRW
ncbi:hypothetical protein SEA_JKSYNGBOY_17 [Gordonia phage JKSyngboy]|uniref:Uncharacterized protein n=1 Tax=Gordonia phage JKSyngboy TaxID=2762400 RepID=A0A7G8LL69_9CAUD|nr:hypothetical protein J1762_gp17 [Gordonia phage JKSyngboy]QNJ57991.1 hypothetical protein SEA_JKSYNGBOY_17 [Gordonia phage JKSyngboy]